MRGQFNDFLKLKITYEKVLIEIFENKVTK